MVSNPSDWPITACAISLPERLASATPCPENPLADRQFGAGRAKQGMRFMVIASVPPQPWVMRTPFSCG